MRGLAALLFIALLVACGSSDPVIAEPTGFVRAPSPNGKMTAAYLTITLDREDRLVAVSVDGAARTEMHTATKEGGISRMRMVEGYDLTPGEALVLEPGGRHLMLFGLEDGFAEAGERRVILTFESGEEQELLLPIKRQGDVGHAGH